MSEVEARKWVEELKARPQIEALSRPRRSSVDLVGSVVLKMRIMVP